MFYQFSGHKHRRETNVDFKKGHQKKEKILSCLVKLMHEAQ